MKKRILFFAPHPDDETLGCGGTIAKKISEGYELLIVVMTDGRQLRRNYKDFDSDTSSILVKEIRKEEMIKAIKILGVKKDNIIFYNFEDRLLNKNHINAIDFVVVTLHKYSPIEIYYPSIHDSHPDHRATNLIVKKATKIYDKDIEKYVYEISPRYGRLHKIIFPLLCLYYNKLSVNISNHLHLKKMAIKEYKFTFNITDKEQLFNQKYFKKYIKTEETYLRVR